MKPKSYNILTEPDMFIKRERILVGSSVFRNRNVLEYDIRGSDLRNSNLGGAYIIRSDLSYVDFYKSSFRFTQFYCSDLINSNLFGVTFKATHFIDCDLTGTILENTVQGNNTIQVYEDSELKTISYKRYKDKVIVIDTLPSD